MRFLNITQERCLALLAVVFFGAGMSTANAESPCPVWGGFEEFGDCKVLVETNSSDGDVGFHFLIDGDNLIRTSLFNPDWRKIWSYYTRREARKQTFTESFNESAEPLCFDPVLDNDPEDPETMENDEDDFSTLADFVDLDDDSCLAPIVPNAEGIVIVVAGGHGRHMNAVLNSSYSVSVTQPIARQDGTPVKSVRDFLD